MENRFDQLARSLAGATSRREALRRLGGFLAGTFAATLGMGEVWGQGDQGGGQADPCRVACRRCSGRARDKCLVACYACPSPGYLCGSCGRVACCTGGKVCSGGRCVCPTGSTDCGGTCVDRQSDSGNCWTCGNVCTGGTFCNSGVCQCPGGTTDCGGTCVALDSDPKNWGACSHPSADGLTWRGAAG